MRQWTATHMAKLARKASIAVGKRVQTCRDRLQDVDHNILRKLAKQVDDIVFIRD